MSGNKVYRGAFSEQLKSFIEEKRMLGCRYVEEERLSYEFDKLSLQYDCSNGLNADLVNEFINVNLTGRLPLRRDISALYKTLENIC